MKSSFGYICPFFIKEIHVVNLDFRGISKSKKGLNNCREGTERKIRTGRILIKKVEMIKEFDKVLSPAKKRKEILLPPSLREEVNLGNATIKAQPSNMSIESKSSIWTRDSQVGLSQSLPHASHFLMPLSFFLFGQPSQFLTRPN